MGIKNKIKKTKTINYEKEKVNKITKEEAIKM